MRAKSEQLGYVQRRVAKGEYRVDAKRVAAAMLERIGAIALDREVSGRSDHGREAHAADRRDA